VSLEFICTRLPKENSPAVFLTLFFAIVTFVFALGFLGTIDNSTNSCKSLLSGIGMAAVAQFNDESDAFLGSHCHKLTSFGIVGSLKLEKTLNLFLHREIIRLKLFNRCNM